jgi:hypothetical protein
LGLINTGCGWGLTFFSYAGVGVGGDADVAVAERRGKGLGGVVVGRENGLL